MIDTPLTPDEAEVLYPGAARAFVSQLMSEKGSTDDNVMFRGKLLSYDDVIWQVFDGGGAPRQRWQLHVIGDKLLAKTAEHRAVDYSFSWHEDRKQWIRK